MLVPGEPYPLKTDIPPSPGPAPAPSISDFSGMVLYISKSVINDSARNNCLLVFLTFT